MGVDVSAVARVLGITTEFKDLRGGNARFLPQRIAVFAQGSSGLSYSTEKWQATSAGGHTRQRRSRAYRPRLDPAPMPVSVRSRAGWTCATPHVASAMPAM